MLEALCRYQYAMYFLCAMVMVLPILKAHIGTGWKIGVTVGILGFWSLLCFPVQRLFRYSLNRAREEAERRPTIEQLETRVTAQDQEIERLEKQVATLRGQLVKERREQQAKEEEALRNGLLHLREELQ